MRENSLLENNRSGFMVINHYLKYEYTFMVNCHNIVLYEYKFCNNYMNLCIKYYLNL